MQPRENKRRTRAGELLDDMKAHLRKGEHFIVVIFEAGDPLPTVAATVPVTETLMTLELIVSEMKSGEGTFFAPPRRERPS